MVNLHLIICEAWWILNDGAFYSFLFCLFESEFWPRKNKSVWWIFTQLYFCSGGSRPSCFEEEVNWWWILTQRFCWKGEQRWRLEVGRFKTSFDVCINTHVKGHLEPTHLKSSPLFTFSTKLLGQDSPLVHLFSITTGPDSLPQR